MKTKTTLLTVIALFLILFSCKKKDNNEEIIPENNNTIIYTFTGNIDGSSVNYTTGSNGFEDIPLWTSSTWIDKDKNSYGFAISNYQNIGMTLRKEGLMTNHGVSPTQQEFISFFSSGNTSFSNDSTNGMLIEYNIDSDIFTTRYTDNSSNTITFSQFEQTTDEGLPAFKFKATFNCTLKNFSGGTTKILTDCEMTGIFAYSVTGK